MNVRNELYSVLSGGLHNQDFLLVTELPNTVTIFEHNYEMQYSPSYTGNIHDKFSSIGFDFCMPIGNAIQISMEENYHMFLMTVQCNTVGIYCDENGKFKIFDSHVRDLFGLPHPRYLHSSSHANKLLSKSLPWLRQFNNFI